MDAPIVRRISISVENAAATPSGPDQPAVLLVIGDPDLRAAAKRVLEDEGYCVYAAAHSGHAWLQCLTVRRLDAVVTELSMDDTSGPALAQRLRRYHPQLQALYLANGGTPECGNVLVRPFTRDDLTTRIETLVATALTY